MSTRCPGCRGSINSNDSTSYYNGGLWHTGCAENDRRLQNRYREEQLMCTRQYNERQYELERQRIIEARAAADRREELERQRIIEARAAEETREEILRASTAYQEQLAREALWEQQQARAAADRAEQHALEQKNLTKQEILYRNALSEAKDGNVDSMVYVAKCFLDGYIVNKSDSNSKKWLLQAIDSNSYEALIMVHRLWESLTDIEKEKVVSKWTQIVGESRNASEEDFINIFKCLKKDNNKLFMDFVVRFKDKMPIKAWYIAHTRKCAQCGKKFFHQSDAYVKFCSDACNAEYKKIRKMKQN